MTETTARRDEILAAAAELFARKGIKATTVREIGDAVGILSGSLYYHFDSKDAMAREILLDFLRAIRERYDVAAKQSTDAADGLRRLILASVELAHDKPHATVIYQTELAYLRENPNFREVLTAGADVQLAWLDLIERGVAEGAFRADVSPRVFHRLVRDAVWLSGRGHRRDDGYTTRQLADDITTIFLNGYAASASAGSPQAGQASDQRP